MRGERDRENGRVASVMLVRRAWRPESGWKKATPPSRYSHVEAQAGSDPCHPPTPPTALSTCHLFFFSPLSLRGACFRGSEAGTGATASRHARHVTRFAMGGGGPGSDNCSIYIWGKCHNCGIYSGKNATTVVFTLGKFKSAPPRPDRGLGHKTPGGGFYNPANKPPGKQMESRFRSGMLQLGRPQRFTRRIMPKQ